MLTAKRLRELLHYDRKTGAFTWRSSGKGRRSAKGLAAGCSSAANGHHRYWRIRVDGVLYHAHRLAWFYVHGEWPPQHTDHKETRSDGLRNLRPCTVSQNLANTGLRADNTSGFKGVTRAAGSASWRAQIQAAYLGSFADPKDAARAYDREAIRRFGKFARTNRKLGLL